MVVGISGHRPQKLGGYGSYNPTLKYVRRRIGDGFTYLKPNLVITGMALGVDQIAAEVALELKIPYLAAVPFWGQEAKWPSSAQTRYHRLLAHASKIVVVSKGGYTKAAMDKRNEFIVAKSDRLLAVWNGKREGGTYHCVQLGRKELGTENVYVITPRKE